MTETRAVAGAGAGVGVVARTSGCSFAPHWTEPPDGSTEGTVVVAVVGTDSALPLR